MIIYGSGKMIASLQPLDLIDEYHLWIHPVALGKGKPLFTQGQSSVSLELFGTHTFKTGVIILYYRRTHGL
jgi:dihydrofolate reductase